MLLETIKFFFLGLIQGITEPIPVSSSGHLLLLYHYFGVGIEGQKQLGFAVLVNFASLLAVLLIYREDLSRLARNSLLYLKEQRSENKDDFQFVLFIILGTVPAAVLGVLFNDVIEEHLTGVKTIGGTLLVTAVALFIIRNLKGRKNDGDLTVKEALIIGFAQAIALIPGISRSGATIVAGMLIGLKQETALRFSFLLFIPVSLGGMLLESEGILQVMKSPGMFLPYMVAFFASLVASYFSLKWFMNVMRQGNLIIFAVYCFIVGPLVLIFS
ncbi:undecaprenyl-diphosphatase [Melghirimyces profundicolus]|uniref:Undecaprenyl-diphosphatase n=1 Tax=Melghirimyces profundicolus TaxID=1242148 RepID=A0A2T6C8D8_9BACL|nr:undecaprenyl-diphosphate phosphatase [Melghirimyces profundicolus]PTX64578.1 undecaprenyl-diphosphatase [Melghirimyces profundicolus]